MALLTIIIPKVGTNGHGHFVCGLQQRVEERFHRDPSKPASKDVAERIFMMPDRQIRVTFHLEDDRIIPAWLNFIKPKEAADSQKAEAFTPQMVSGFQV